MPSTTNFGWTTPADTDLVKDGAAAIRTLAGGIDTSFVDLKGGTTGQVLSKNSNTDLDFAWVAQDDSNAIQNTIMDAKGDLISASAADTPARLASSGVNGDVLTVDTSTSTGLKWAAVSANGMTSIATGTLSGASVSITSIPTTYNELWLYINGFDPATDDAACLVTLNNVTTGSKYFEWAQGQTSIASGGNADSLNLIRASDNTVVTGAGILKLLNYNSTNSIKLGQIWSVGLNNTTPTTFVVKSGFFTFADTNIAISSLQLKPDTGNFDGGTYQLYGVK